MKNSGIEHEKWITHINLATTALSKRSWMYIQTYLYKYTYMGIHIHTHYLPK